MKSDVSFLGPIKVVIGLGNPGPKFALNRHNIGFLVVDFLSDKYGSVWRPRGEAEVADLQIDGFNIVLVKPQTFMNLSGKVFSNLAKQGIKAENILVVHDELDLPFGKIKTRIGGSARGHNGIKSMIEHCGYDFARLRVGIDRPEDRSDVPNYVLRNFTESDEEVTSVIESAASIVEELIMKSNFTGD